MNALMVIEKNVRRVAAPLAVLLGSILPLAGGATTPMQPEQWCAKLTPRLPGISNATCKEARLTPTGINSRLGFPLLSRQLSADKKQAENHRPLRVLLMGGIHGDELTSASIVFRWLQWMPAAEAKRFEWSVVPVMNPDGLLAKKAKRVNANGVDLNRNFPTSGWQKDAPRYWAVRTGSDPRRFPGPAPLSEPESRWVNDEMVRFHPDVIISVHAPFGVLDFDGPAQPPRRFGRLLLNRVGVYPGSLGNYSGIHKNVPVITIELPNAQKMPSDAEVKRIWVDMLGWINANVVSQTDAARMHSAALPAAPEKPPRIQR